MARLTAFELRFANKGRLNLPWKIMKLDLEGYPRFEPLLLKVWTAAFTHGLETLRSMGFAANSHDAVREALISDQARRRFVRSVHTGYDQAQRMIGSHTVEWERQIRDLEQKATAGFS